MLAEETTLSPEQQTRRWQAAEGRADLNLDDPTDIPGWICSNVVIEQREHAGVVASIRRHPTLAERRFHQEAKARWPHARFRRYAPVSIVVHAVFGPSIWYAPFLCRPKKLIVILADRPDFPYRVYGQNTALYASQGYTVLDFSEDFSCPTDESVWENMMVRAENAIGEARRGVCGAGSVGNR